MTFPANNEFQNSFIQRTVTSCNITGGKGKRVKTKKKKKKEGKERLMGGWEERKTTFISIHYRYTLYVRR